MPAPDSISRLTPSQLLRTSQSTGPNAKAARDALVERFDKLLKKQTAQTCRRYHLDDQERDEVLAETYQQLLNPEIARFKPRRGKPQHYFKGLVQNAARKTLTQVGARSRKRRGPEIAEGHGAAPHEIGEDEAVVGRYSIAAAPPPPEAETELRDAIDYVMSKAPPHIRRALELCYWDEWPVQSIATHLGVNRSTLAREIRAFLDQMSAELGAD